MVFLRSSSLCCSESVEESPQPPNPGSTSRTPRRPWHTLHLLPPPSLLALPTAESWAAGEGGAGGAAAGALDPRQLPLEGEDSEAGAARSCSFSRMCVQCTSAWISKGSAAPMLCSSLWFPASVPGGGVWRRWGAGREKTDSQGRRGSKTTGEDTEGNVTTFARISLNQTEAKTESKHTRTHVHTCTHTHTHTHTYARIHVRPTSWSTWFSHFKLHVTVDPNEEKLTFPARCGKYFPF